MEQRGNNKRTTSSIDDRLSHFIPTTMAQLLPLAFLLISTYLPVSLDAQGTNNNPAAAAADPPFSFSFNFSDPSSYESRDLKFEGDAMMHGNKIDLTCNSFGQSPTGCVGRMSYSHAVPFHDDTTVASFTTSFTFAILTDNNGDAMPGDGMAFFLSGYPSSMPLRSGGDHLGLLNTTAPYGAGQFVAVEFDTYKNDECKDPSVNHIGVDINSVVSKNTTILPNLTGTMTATISFNNVTGLLVASLQSHDNASMKPVVVTGVLSDVRNLLPRQVAVGFSAATGQSIELHQILAWSFNSTIALPATPYNKGPKTIIIIVGGVSALVLLLLVAWFILSCWKWSNRSRGFETHGKQKPTRFEFRDLAAATEQFSQAKKLGEGYFGVVYRGHLNKVGREVAIKEIKSQQAAPGPNSDLFAELNAITSVKHKNLVKLFGWCRGNSWSFVEFMCWCWKNGNNNRLFLVYELVPKGSLHDHLHKKAETLPWATRYKIVKDITSALLYLHHECDQLILHRDIKPGNILLDDNFNAKLADFGLSRTVDRDTDSSRVLTVPVGTQGYLDPECMEPEGEVEFSRSSDVYSYGIVLLEIACKERMVRELVWQHYINGSLLLAADDRLNGEFNKTEMESVIILGLWCSYPDSKKRPSMEQVMAVLEHGKPLPDLKSLDTASVPTQQEMYIDLPAPSSAGSSSYEQHA